MGQTKQVQRPCEVPRYPIFVICCEQILEPEDVGRLCAGAVRHSLHQQGLGPRPASQNCPRRPSCTAGGDNGECLGCLRKRHAKKTHVNFWPIASSLYLKFSTWFSLPGNLFCWPRFPLCLSSPAGWRRSLPWEETHVAGCVPLVTTAKNPHARLSHECAACLAGGSEFREEPSSHLAPLLPWSLKGMTD